MHADMRALSCASSACLCAAFQRVPLGELRMADITKSADTRLDDDLESTSTETAWERSPYTYVMRTYTSVYLPYSESPSEAPAVPAPATADVVGPALASVPPTDPLFTQQWHLNGNFGVKLNYSVPVTGGVEDHWV